MNIFSETLGKEIEVKAFETEAGSLLSHDDLMKVFIDNTPRFSYQLIPDKVEKDHSVYRCIMEDTISGSRIESVGESTPETLTTKISSDYPSLMAAKRAFDEAMITILRLPGKFYSNQQITEHSSASEPEPIEELPVNNDGIKETIEEKQENSGSEPVKEDEGVDLDNIKDFTMAFSLSKGKSFREVYNDKTRWNGIKNWLEKAPKLKYADELRNKQLTYVRAVIAKEKEMEEKKSA